jgi:hypothetical protein
MNPAPVKLKFEKVRATQRMGQVLMFQLGVLAVCIDGEEKIRWIQI